jgi:hypothetical protein
LLRASAQKGIVMMPRFSFPGPRPDGAADELLATADRLEISLSRNCDGSVSIGVTLEAALGAEPCCGDESSDPDRDARRQASDRAIALVGRLVASFSSAGKDGDA